MSLKKEKLWIIVAGCIIGIISAMLVYFGNPQNMGFCIACFLRDTAGALGLHRAGAVQYIRPEIIGLVLGSFLMALSKKEFSSKGGSAPMTRFVLGFIMMLGALVLVLLEGRHAYKAISQYGFSNWLDTQLDSPVYMVLTILIVAGLLAGGIASMISVRREGKKIEELKRRRMIEE